MRNSYFTPATHQSVHEVYYARSAFLAPGNLKGDQDDLMYFIQGETYVSETLTLRFQSQMVLEKFWPCLFIHADWVWDLP